MSNWNNTTNIRSWRVSTKLSCVIHQINADLLRSAIPLKYCDKRLTREYYSYVITTFKKDQSKGSVFRKKNLTAFDNNNITDSNRGREVFVRQRITYGLGYNAKK